MTPSKARMNEVKRTPTTNDIFWFRSSAAWIQKASHGTKLYDQW